MVDGVPGDPTALAVLRAIIALGKALGLAIYAEGIESEIQRAAITAEGCDYLARLPARPTDAERQHAGTGAHSARHGPRMTGSFAGVTGSGLRRTGGIVGLDGKPRKG